MHILEENYLRVIGLLDYYTNRINMLFENEKMTPETFASKYPVYSDLTMSLYHSAVVQARKLYEAELARDSLTSEEWLKLKVIRNEILHANEPQSKELRVVASINEDLIPILNKLSNEIIEKHNLHNNESFVKYSKQLAADLSKL